MILPLNREQLCINELWRFLLRQEINCGSRTRSKMYSRMQNVLVVNVTKKLFVYVRIL
jgi:hypothetical protein